MPIFYAVTIGDRMTLSSFCLGFVCVSLCLSHLFFFVSSFFLSVVFFFIFTFFRISFFLPFFSHLVPWLVEWTYNALWSKKTKNSDVSTGLLACRFACLLTQLTNFRACGKVNDLMAIFAMFFSVLDHSAKGQLDTRHAQVQARKVTHKRSKCIAI